MRKITRTPLLDRVLLEDLIFLLNYQLKKKLGSVGIESVYVHVSNHRKLGFKNVKIGTW